MDNKRIIFIVVIVTALIVAVLFGGWYYFGRVPKVATVPESELPVSPAGFVPQGISPARPGGEWTFAGIIRKMDINNKFFEIKTAPAYPVSLQSFGYDDIVRVYFDDSLIFPNMKVETEDDAVVRVSKGVNIGLSQIGPGMPVRASGELRPDGTFFARFLYLYDYRKK